LKQSLDLELRRIYYTKSNKLNNHIFLGVTMRNMTRVLIITAICFLGIGCTIQEGYQASSSLISNRLEAWGCYLQDPEAKVQDVWNIEDGVLICSGKPLGYLYTKRDYGNFVLKLEWRWPPGKKPGKGGVLVRMTGEHRIWPRSLEAQLNTGGAGDFWGLVGYGLSGPAERMQSLEHQEFGTLTNLKKVKDLEKSPGQWNTYEIIAKGDTVTLIINGEEVNRATGCDLNPGRICLTSEGSEIHFRNVVVTP
jgi:hypothetical protein